MSDPRIRAERYRRNAAECRELAGIASDQAIIVEYQRIAEHYIHLAEAEDKLATELDASLKRA
jgi:hypothetical protein